ncbi:MAG: hypothetical protein ACREQF_08880 [Candidatus Binataceae bacterium]
MPPRFGTLDVAKWADSVPTINGFGTEKWLLKGAQVLELHMEITDELADALIPRTMHPSIPQYAIFNVTHYPDSPAGAFTIAEVRIAGRAGVRPRSHVLRSIIDSEAARKELAARWGFPVQPGKVTLEQRHDRVVGLASIDGKSVLHIESLDRDAIGGNDIQWIASMNLARNKEDGKLVLVQVDPDFVFSKAERGRAVVVHLDNDAFRANGYLKVNHPISASFAICDVTLPKIRYVCNPELPAMQGTTKIAA